MKKGLAVLALLILIVVIGAVVYFQLQPKATPPKIIPTKKPAASSPPQATCPVDGLVTTPEKAKRRPLAIMIENSPSARPHSGLSKACLVYETVAEGGITRFMAIYVHQDVKNIGPVRSAREYYVNIYKYYNAIYAHCGGSSTGLSAIRRLGLADLDEMANAAAFWRIKSRRAPHNLYTSTERLWKQAKRRGYSLEGDYKHLAFKKEPMPFRRAKSASITINFSTSSYQVKYKYNRKSNSYARFLAGAPHIDAATGKQIMVKNIAVQYIPTRLVDRKGHVGMKATGSGKAFVFLDGKAISAKWMRASVSERTKFLDKEGEEIKLNPGQTWIEIISPGKKVTYSSVEEKAATFKQFLPVLQRVVFTHND